MRSKLVGFALGIIVGALIFGSFALAAGIEFKTLSAEFRDIVIEIDGVAIEPKDVNGKEVEPFIVDGTTYVPARAISEALGKAVSWVPETNTVVIEDPSDEVVEECEECDDGAECEGEECEDGDGEEVVEEEE